MGKNIENPPSSQGIPTIRISLGTRRYWLYFHPRGIQKKQRKSGLNIAIIKSMVLTKSVP
jgi:hypothetical protein